MSAGKLRCGDDPFHRHRRIGECDVVPDRAIEEHVFLEHHANLPAQPTDMDERITVPQGAMPPDEIPQMGPVSEELVEPDIIQTGELSFLPPERASQRPLKDRLVNVGSVLFHILLVLFLIFEPKIFGPHVRKIGRAHV